MDQQIVATLLQPPPATFTSLNGAGMGMCGVTSANKALCWGPLVNGSDVVSTTGEKVCPGEETTGYAALLNGLDCDPSDASIYPNATELCDGLDNDCDGTADTFGAGSGTVYYVDSDGDGFGDAVTRDKKTSVHLQPRMSTTTTTVTTTSRC